MATSENDWILLSLYLTNQATDEQTRAVLVWRDACYENRAIFADAQHILKHKNTLPTFDSFKAFQKLSRKIMA